MCLGAGIQGYRSYPIYTTLNQCRLRGDVVIGYPDGGREVLTKGERATLDAPQYVWHDGIGYVLGRIASGRAPCISFT